jgi:hypothetical protein
MAAADGDIPATLGILVSSLAASALVRRFAQRSLIVVGFLITNLGSSFGTAIVGTLLVSSVTGPADGSALAMAPLIAVAIAGLVVASFLPGRAARSSVLTPRGRAAAGVPPLELGERFSVSQGVGA